MSHIKIDIITEVDRLAIQNPIDAFTVFQTDSDSGFYQYNATNSSWDYIGGRPPKR